MYTFLRFRVSSGDSDVFDATLCFGDVSSTASGDFAPAMFCSVIC